MRIINSGRFSVTLYDKHTGEGIRVFVDPVKVKAFPEIDKWFFCLVPKKETDVNKLMEEVREFGSKVLGMRRVKVDIKSLPSPEEYKYALCSVCGESHIDDGKDVCLACRGKAYISDIRE
jgi:formylmethanofuran dehydrogenase subunit E